MKVQVPQPCCCSFGIKPGSDFCGFLPYLLRYRNRASKAKIINLHFSLQFKKSCINDVLASAATLKLYISGMSSTSTISQGKLPNDALRVRFKLSLGSRSSALQHLSSSRSYFIIQLHRKFRTWHLLLFSHLVFIVKD